MEVPVLCFLDITGPEEEIEKFSLAGPNGILDLNVAVPINLHDKPEAIWGCSSNAEKLPWRPEVDHDFVPCGKTYWFATAYAPPLLWLAATAQRRPKLSYTLQWACRPLVHTGMKCIELPRIIDSCTTGDPESVENFIADVLKGHPR